MNEAICTKKGNCGTFKEVSATKSQPDLAARIKESQDCLLRWEKNFPQPSPKKDPEAYAQYKRIKKWSVEDCHEKLLVMTGNPRGFLPCKGRAQ
jgi:hypothetical protein